MLKHSIKELQQQNEDLTRKMEEMEAEQLKARRKAHPLEGIALLAEEAKDLWGLLTKAVICYVLKNISCL